MCVGNKKVYFLHVKLFLKYDFKTHIVKNDTNSGLKTQMARLHSLLFKIFFKLRWIEFLNLFQFAD